MNFLNLFTVLTTFFIVLGNTLLTRDRAHAMAAEIGTTIKPTPVTDEVKDAVVGPIITSVSNYYNVEVRVL